MTQGWTGRKCPKCKGTGEFSDEWSSNRSCPDCAGTGDEYGEVEEDTKRIEEPEK